MFRAFLGRSIASGALLALSASVALEGCENSCDPGEWLFSDCHDDEESCNAETRTCEEQLPCATSGDCPGGYVCYDTGRCALNCQNGLNFFTDYCKPGWSCADDFTCLPPPEAIARVCDSGCSLVAAACGEPDSGREATCFGECVSHWRWQLANDHCTTLEEVDGYAECLAGTSFSVDCQVMKSGFLSGDAWWRATWWSLEPFASSCGAPPENPNWDIPDSPCP